MGITAISGPHVSYGITQTSSGAVTEYNEERGPDVSDLGIATLDPRYYFNYDPGNPVGTKLYGFFDNHATVDYVPVAGSSIISNTAATAPSAGAALTLSSTTSVISTTIVAPETGTTVSVLALESTAAYLSFGSGGTVAMWNPRAGAGRTIKLIPSGNSSLDGGNWVVIGRDVYGIKLTEQIACSSQTMNGLKAFKYISSIIAATTIGSTGISVGVGDTFGLPLVATYNSIDTQCRVNATSSATATPAQSNVAITVGASATATSTTGDVRGTWASSVATNGTARVQILQRITANMVASVTASDTSGMFGVAQYSSV